MCLLTLQWHAHPSYPLILVANRDEEYSRGASRLHFWEDAPQLLAGRDLKAMGTWLGVSKSGRVAGITNDPFSGFEPKSPPASRGRLVKNFLLSKESPVLYGLSLKETREEFNGYQLLFGDLQQLYTYHNASGCFAKLTPGTYSLSNAPSSHVLEKTNTGSTLLNDYTRQNQELDPAELAALFHHTEPAEDISFLTSHTGMDTETARKYSSVFIEGDTFGTVSTAVILFDKNGRVSFLERKYNTKGMFHDTTISFDIEQHAEQKSGTV